MTTPGDLQFDRAEPGSAATAPTSCAVCKQPLPNSYYEVNGKVVCPQCHENLAGHLRTGNFGTAALLGLGAALLGAAIYFGIELATGYEFGLVAILVGWLVGKGVRKGSRGAGGWRYQALAIGLTYLAVVAVDASLIVRALVQERESKQVASTTASDSASVTVQAPATDGSTPATSGNQRSPVMAMLVLAGLALAAPVLIGISAPLHFVIVGFALYEAWKFNSVPAFQVSGPYRLENR